MVHIELPHRLAAGFRLLFVLVAVAPPGRALPAQQPARSVDLGFPVGLALLPDGDLLVSERRTHRIQRLDLQSGVLSPFAGDGTAGFSGDGGPAAAARLSCPDAIDVDASGTVYVSDRCNERIRRIDGATGIITTIAGTGERGPSADGPALSVALTGVFYLRLAPDGTLLFTDTDANLVRQLDLRTGTVTTLAGSGEDGFAGDGGPALEASLSRPHVVLRLRNGDLLIGDSFNHRLRLVDHAKGTITTLAGTGEEAPARDGVAAGRSPLVYFGEIHELDDGDLLWTEWGSSQIVRLDRATGRLHVVAGTTEFGRADRDGTPLAAAAIGSGVDMVIDSRGRLIIAAAGAGLVRRIDLERGTLETLAGAGRRQ